MAIAVFESSGDYGEHGIYGIQKLLGAGCPAAVMRHLEDVNVLQFAGLDHLPFNLLLYVAAEQERMPAVVQPEHQRIIVLRLLRRSVIRERRKHVDIGASEAEVIGSLPRRD